MKAEHCLACGSRLRPVREERRTRRRCPRCGWTFYNNPVPAVVGVIRNRRGQILLVRRAAPPYEGSWDLPGGFLEAGELPEPALRREIREEVGARPVRMRLLGFFNDTYGTGGFPILATVYTARLAGSPRAASDVSEVAWYSPRNLPYREIRFRSVREALRSYLEGR